MTTMPIDMDKAKALSKDDPLYLIDVDHVRFNVGNAKQAAYFYSRCFGFNISQVSDLTTGARNEAQYLLTQGNIRILLCTGLQADSEGNRHVSRFGDGVKDIAFTVFDAEAAYEQAIRNGGVSAMEPTVIEQDGSRITRAAIKTYGQVVHSFISREGDFALPRIKDGGAFAPGFEPRDYAINAYNDENPCGLMYFDHCVGNVEEGRMNEWVQWYEDVMGFALFKHFDDNDISTEHSALMSKVMASGNQLIKMPINEPADGLRKSQIEEYLDWHDQTPGVQHLAFRTNDELASVAELRRRGVDFLTIPDAYYDAVWDRVGVIEEDRQRVKDLGILVDRDEEGYLLQLFTMPLQDRP
ncbi:MAG: 4-hydroxyphenylpyruvate dioxygenase, partial [Phycisphaerales bacterium]|nr:4-hydroxyphenylpyruvate dioxygenase [Phycisphaerales bacterium]